MFGEGFNKQMYQDAGQRGYVWALSQVLGKRINGYIIDAIRIRKPSRKREYLEEAPVDKTDFDRFPYAVSEDEIERWKRDTLQKINMIFFMHDTGIFPQYEWMCSSAALADGDSAGYDKYGSCDFYDCCTQPRREQEGVLYNSTLYEEADWSPLHLPNKENNTESKENVWKQWKY